MKQLITILVFMLSFTLSGYAEETEKTKPIFNTEVIRRVNVMDIEGQIFNDVVITIKSIEHVYVLTNNYRVNVKIVDRNGKKIWRKTLKNVFLYVFSTGQVQVGNGNFIQILIDKSSLTGNVSGTIRIQEGIF